MDRAERWCQILASYHYHNELHRRGFKDILLAVIDGLKGFPDAVRGVFLEALVQTCIVHQLRHSLNFVTWKERKYAEIV
ncbi:hypothetical protein AA0313_1941 [Acetobacter indonesiensis NRIC 0313]|uniref:Mutator family transposase n=1 Tax=Acetobacter indonesiensis TaxID=104101 RepID=A0A6N3T8I6_9PROT|nr:transposase mutator type [Acetobacter indonesiensis]GBQ58953.1 hypothetical protein AA0313_1941 [Acetobacter indonesiensis NRIC 0313]GEN04885.1 hypothetical protein AIN02nite_29100 [Acetobacter indonesiensis]